MATSVPRALARMCSIELVDDVEVDVGLEQGDADLAQGVGDVFFGEVPWPRRVLKERWSLSVRFSNIGQRQVYRASGWGALRAEEANALDSQELWDSALVVCYFGRGVVAVSTRITEFPEWWVYLGGVRA